MTGILEKAREVCREISNAQPLTNFGMFEALLHRGVSLAAFVEDPASLEKLCPVETDADATSFLERITACICTVMDWGNRLQKKYPDEFEFNYFKMGDHWVGLCQKTMVLLDERAKFGAVKLEKDTQGHWIASQEGQNPVSEMEWKWDGKTLTVAISEEGK